MTARRRRTKWVDGEEEIDRRQKREQQHFQSTLKEATGFGFNSIDEESLKTCLYEFISEYQQ